MWAGGAPSGSAVSTHDWPGEPVVRVLERQAATSGAPTSSARRSAAQRFPGRSLLKCPVGKSSVRLSTTNSTTRFAASSQLHPPHIVWGLPTPLALIFSRAGSTPAATRASRITRARLSLSCRGSRSLALANPSMPTSVMCGEAAKPRIRSARKDAVDPFTSTLSGSNAKTVERMARHPFKAGPGGHPLVRASAVFTPGTTGHASRSSGTPSPSRSRGGKGGGVGAGGAGCTLSGGGSSAAATTVGGSGKGAAGSWTGAQPVPPATSQENAHHTSPKWRRANEVSRRKERGSRGSGVPFGCRTLRDYAFLPPVRLPRLRSPGERTARASPSAPPSHQSPPFPSSPVSRSNVIGSSRSSPGASSIFASPDIPSASAWTAYEPGGKPPSDHAPSVPRKRS